MLIIFISNLKVNSCFSYDFFSLLARKLLERITQYTLQSRLLIHELSDCFFQSFQVHITRMRQNFLCWLWNYLCSSLKNNFPLIGFEYQNSIWIYNTSLTY